MTGIFINKPKRMDKIQVEVHQILPTATQNFDRFNRTGLGEQIIGHRFPKQSKNPKFSRRQSLII
jgi:hypothetical protein